MTSRRSGRRPGSVQALLPLEAVVGDVMVLRDGSSRAVLETTAINFALRSEAEQEGILAGYRRLLNGLSYPIQVLVRVAPADVERYLAGLTGAGSARLGEAGPRLARDHAAFVRRIARERAPLERRFFVVVSGEADAGARPAAPSLPWRRAERRHSELTAAAPRMLAVRCEELTQALASFGVRARRLAGDELVALWREAIAGGARSASSARWTGPEGVNRDA